MSQPWTALFTISRQFYMEKNLDGITQDQADNPPAARVNSVTWLLTHLVGNRRLLLRTALKSSYQPTDAAPETLARLRAAMDESQAAMEEAFDAIADWNEPRLHPLAQTSMPLDQIVGTFFMDEAYHLGQVGTARKLLGMPGVLKAPQAQAHAMS